MILHHSVLVRSVRCQIGCHGETWAYVTAADNHVLWGSPLIGPGVLRVWERGEMREPRGNLGSWDLDFEREVLCEKCIRLYVLIKSPV